MNKALIWDFDGTLAYREGGRFSAALCEAAQKEMPGLTVTIGQIRPYLQSGFPWHTPNEPHLEIKTADQWWEQLYPVFQRALLSTGLDSAQARSIAREVRPIYVNPEQWHLFDDVIPVLEQLSSQGWLHVILSNHVPELCAIARHLGLERWVARVFNSAETGYEKPHPRAFQTALKYLSGSPVKWMVGDNMNADVEGAKAVGIPAFLVRRQKKEAEYYCQDLSQLPGVLGRVVREKS